MAESNDNVNEQPEPPEEIASEDVVGAQETPSAEQPETEPAVVDEPVAASEPAATASSDGDELEYIEEDETPRVKPAIPGMDLEVDIVREGEESMRSRYSEDEPDEEDDATSDAEEELPQTIADASIDLAAGARYRATGKRKTAVARVTLKPGTGEYIINGKSLEVIFPRETPWRNAPACAATPPPCIAATTSMRVS